MSDRIKGFVVTLETDYRDDDASEIMVTLQNIRGVTSVVPHIVNPSDVMNREQIKRDLIRRLYEILK